MWGSPIALWPAHSRKAKRRWDAFNIFWIAAPCLHQALILASEVYKYNGMYSAEVQAMNDLKQRLSKLDS